MDNNGTKTYAPECAIWEKKDKNGNTYLSVKLPDGTWRNLFKNKFKKDNQKAPDWKEIKTKEDQNNKQDFGPEPKFNESEDIPF